MENLDEPRSHSSPMADRLISQMKIIKTRDAIATGLANPSAVRNVSKRKNTMPAISAQFRLSRAQFRLIRAQFRLTRAKFRSALRSGGARAAVWPAIT